MSMENQTTVTEFILLGLSSEPQIQIFLFLVFLVIYLITLVGNIVIMVLIRADFHLHTPMYFFLFHLSFVDICYSSVTVPNMMLVAQQLPRLVYLLRTDSPLTSNCLALQASKYQSPLASPLSEQLSFLYC
uniref:G-protein coupled receptors family 1 profile domain-containing protein n=1 Tax=Gopherus agassizii TaxID=38772 RepID=A0A452H7B8_9SAUR